MIHHIAILLFTCMTVKIIFLKVVSRLTSFFSLSSKKIGRDKKNHTQSFKIKVYCSCRMPDHFGRKVIQCSVCWSLKNTSKDSDVVLNLYSKI